jgi:2-phospho-L-lactate transferase/gluconeogenesis factor (CofD/UPF0052 family)
MTQPGETEGFTLSDHLKALEPYLNPRVFDFVIVNSEPIPEEILRHYREENSVPVLCDLTSHNPFGLEIVAAPLIDRVHVKEDGHEKLTVKHNAQKLARVIASCAPRLFEGGHRRR